MYRSAAVKFAFTFLATTISPGFLFPGLLSSATAGTVFIVDGSYRGTEDSPFDLSGLGTTFFLEDFEDGKLDTPGVALPGGINLPLAPHIRSPSPDTRSVGNGESGYSLVPSGLKINIGPPKFRQFITFDFAIGELGFLPTSLGMVWTKVPENAKIKFEAYAADGSLLGSIEYLGDTAIGTDAFTGIEDPRGIASLAITSRSVGAGSSRFQIDHLQYGISVPEPISATLAVIGLFFSLAILRRRGT